MFNLHNICSVGLFRTFLFYKNISDILFSIIFIVLIMNIFSFRVKWPLNYFFIVVKIIFEYILKLFYRFYDTSNVNVTHVSIIKLFPNCSKSSLICSTWKISNQSSTATLVSSHLFPYDDWCQQIHCPICLNDCFICRKCACTRSFHNSKQISNHH